MGNNWIWAKADKVDSEFSKIKDHVTLRRIFGKYRIVIQTWVEWEKNWPNQQKKGHIWFTDGACNQQGTGAGICKYQSKIRWHISLGQDATVFQIEVAKILNSVTSCLRKRLVKERIIICTDSQAAVAALGASGIKSLLVPDCKENLTALSEVNQVTTMWVPKQGRIYCEIQKILLKRVKFLRFLYIWVKYSLPTLSQILPKTI